MMELKQFLSALEQICEEKGIPKEKVVETVEMALAAAYKKDYGKKGQIIRAKLDMETGLVKMWQAKLVVDQSMLKEEEVVSEVSETESGAEVASSSKPEAEVFVKKFNEPVEEDLAVEAEQKVRFNPERHIMVDEAQAENVKLKPGDEFEIPLEPHQDFGRIAAQTAKQVIIQRIREVERDVVYENFKEKEGQVLSGVVQRVEGDNIFFDLGKTTGVLFSDQKIPGENYYIGQRKRLYLVEVARESRGVLIVLSRNHPKLVSKLFEFEVPEIASETVVIKFIAREAGSRTKIAVVSTKAEIDPIGACVGQRGTRVQAVINELGGEKIDIILYDVDPVKYISHALSPGKVIEVKITDDKRQEAQAIVAEDQLSLAIGKAGQNVRLAAKLTGWRIDIVKYRIEEPKQEERAKDDVVESTEVDVGKKVVKKKKTKKSKEKEVEEVKEKIEEVVEIDQNTEQKTNNKAKGEGSIKKLKLKIKSKKVKAEN